MHAWNYSTKFPGIQTPNMYLGAHVPSNFRSDFRVIYMGIILKENKQNISIFFF